MHRRRISAVPVPRAARWTSAGALVVAVLTACGGGGGGGNSVSAGGSTASATGTLKLALTDAPACGFDHVYVTVEKIRVHQSSTAQDTDAGWSEVRLEPARRMDLLTLTNGAVQELGTTGLPTGHYTQMRLVLAGNETGANVLANSVQPTGGSEIALTTPSGQESGVKLQSNFDVANGQTTDLVLDFDACKSVVQAAGPAAYHLKPVISAMPRVASAIQGAVTGTLATGSTTVSAQLNGATVRSTTPDSRGNFSIPFLQPGTYTLVIASDGSATGVITGVPVGSGATEVSTAASAIALPASSMSEITGAFSSSTDAAPAVTSAFTDAEVRAVQVLTGGESIEVRSRQADGVLGTYSLKVPQAAPVKAAYTASGPLSFTPDTVGASNYSLGVVVREDATVVIQ
jgi:hypothetical protein